MPALPPTIPVLTAPTAAGKSALAIKLAGEFGLDLLSADAFTVYRGLDIGTAKPTRADRAAAPHHLLDVAEVTENYDVIRWVAAAESLIEELLAQGRRPLVVGGTGFYLRALAQGLPLAPAADSQQRAELEQELAERGLEALLAEIEAVRPDQLPRMERNPRRVVRALEVYRQTGRFPADFGHSEPRFGVQVFAFSPALPELEERIMDRTRQMLEQGWPAEAQWLAGHVSPDLQPTPTAWQALGYREALAVAEGRLTLEGATSEIALTTRRYAKRQRTFIRTQLRAELLLPAETEQQLRQWLAGPGKHPGDRKAAK